MIRKAITFSVLFSLFIVSPSLSKVYMTRDKALSVTFPEADRIEKKTVFLTEEQSRKIESLAKTELESKLYTFYAGKKGEETLGYAVIDTHVLRTKTETLMIVINPDGTLRQVEILAFFEPQDYMPTGNWLNLFQGEPLNGSLWLGRDIPNITGATITSNSLVKSVRRIMAVFEVALKGQN
ncbi:MAG TPA: FMN-binding protein [Thermodesulfobacteriota bacterium]|nr:FMN-binding protein [Thermodesulfobacteriota bacterium]